MIHKTVIRLKNYQIGNLNLQVTLFVIVRMKCKLPVIKTNPMKNSIAQMFENNMIMYVVPNNY